MKKQSFHYLGTVIKDFYIEDSQVSSYGHLHNMDDLPIMDGFICSKGSNSHTVCISIQACLCSVESWLCLLVSTIRRFEGCSEKDYKSFSNDKHQVTHLFMRALLTLTVSFLPTSVTGSYE